MSAKRKLSPVYGNGRWLGRWLGSVGVGIELAGLWVQRWASELQWAGRPFRRERRAGGHG